jgi:hypothetical protein
MPNVNRSLVPFLGQTGNPDTAVETSTPGYAGGDLGTAWDYNNRTYMKVTLAAGSNAGAANQLCFWADRANYIVTNVSTQANLGGVATSFRNNVAGIIRGTVPPGAGFFILIRGYNIPVKEAGAAAGGMLLTANTGTNADALGTAVATYPGTQVIGVVVSATTGGNCGADIDIGNIP